MSNNFSALVSRVLKIQVFSTIKDDVLPYFSDKIPFSFGDLFRVVGNYEINDFIKNEIDNFIDNKDLSQYSDYNQAFTELIKEVIPNILTNDKINSFVSQFSATYSNQQDLGDVIFLPIDSRFSKTLPANTLNSSTGFPKNLYTFNEKTAPQALYDAYTYYQTTFTPQYLLSQYEGCYNVGCCNCSNAPPQDGCSPSDCPCPTTDQPAGPSNIFVIRHAEKSSGDWFINQDGIYRATHLVNWVNKLGENGFPISYIVTCNACSLLEPDASMRPIQTISFVASMLNIPIFVFGNRKNTQETIANIYERCAFKGTNILIAWEHGNLQGILRAIVEQKIINKQINTSYLEYWEQQKNNSFNQNPCQDGSYRNEEFSDSNELQVARNISTPYLNDKTFNFVYHFDENSNCSLYQQPIFTGNSSCMLNVCMFQEGTECKAANLYSTETNSDAELDCEKPSVKWKV